MCDVAVLVEWFSEAQSSRVPHLHTPHVLTLGLLPDRSVSSTAQSGNTTTRSSTGLASPAIITGYKWVRYSVTIV